MKILITGHKGFIGSYLWKMIEESGVDVELDGIGGFVFGNLITVDYLPSSYDGWCFQVTKVEHNVSNADWKTKLACGFMRLIP